MSCQIVVVFLAFWWLCQLIPLLRYCAALRDSRPLIIADDKLPKMGIMVPLRGGDEHLLPALRCILRQDYPEYEVTIIVDRRDDPAWEVAERAIEEWRELREGVGRKADAAAGSMCGPSQIHLTVLHRRSPNCGLVNNAILQFLDELSPSCQVIGFSGADDPPPPHWLRETSGALQDENVGTTLGNRWYLPEHGNWGSLVRYLYAAGAVVPMRMFQIPWGGAVALRVSDVRRSGLAEQWGRGMVEDGPMKEAYAKLGLRLQFAPQLISAVPGEVTLRRCYTFMRRQIFWTRLYHPQWAFIVINALYGTAAVISPLILVPLAFVRGDRWSIAAACAAIAYQLGLLVLLYLLNRAVQRLLAARGQALPTFTLGRLLRTALAVPLAQLFFMAAILDCQWRRRIEWGGTHYEVDGPWQIRALHAGAEEQPQTTNKTSMR